MSSSEISDKATISELIGVLQETFLKREFKNVEKILISREEELKRLLQVEKTERGLLVKISGESGLEKMEMHGENERLKNENLKMEGELKKLRSEKPRDEVMIGLLRKIHSESELEKMEMRSENERLKNENLKMEEELKKVRSEKEEAEVIAHLHTQKIPQYEIERLKSENLKMQEELKKLRSEKQEAAKLYSKNITRYEERLSCLEKSVASMLSKSVSKIGASSNSSPATNDLQKEGNGNLNHIQTVENANHCENTETSSGAQSPCHGPPFETIPSHQEKSRCNSGTLGMRKDLFTGEDICVVPKVQIDYSRENDSPAASTSIDRISGKEFNDKEQVLLGKSTQPIPLASPVSNRPQSKIILIDSDDEAPTEKSFVANTRTVEVNSGNSGVTRPIKSNSLKNLPPKRKRGLILSDDSDSDSDSNPVCKQKVEAVKELVHAGKASVVVYPRSAATCSQTPLPTTLIQEVKKRSEEKSGASFGLRTPIRQFDFGSSDDSSDDGSTETGAVNKMISTLKKRGKM